ncbi:MAG: C1 family peptidase [Lachnospiraceae bacterium]|jgi:bleomycin hydrolase|nr:C1 family peptidase [Lachnospiraceae bacterium]MCI1726067.1 C1 family peptidase [Lachnospiraceae bacterium]
MSQFRKITQTETEEFRKAYEADALSHAMTNALYKTDIKELAYRPKVLADSQFTFSTELETLPVTNQKKSGRCWIFAALNLLREKAAKTCGLDSFELSQNYMAFWDKFEKVNYFLESMIALADRPTDDRLVSYLLTTGIADGGQWDMFVNLAEKYGVIPKAAMEETYQSSNTAGMNKLLDTKLRQYASALRKVKTAGGDVQAAKKKMLEETFRFLCMCFGEPPKTFDFEYTDRKKKYHIDRNLTPQQFYSKYIGGDLKDDYVSIINSPTEDKPFYSSCTIDYLGNVSEGVPVHYLNLPMEEMISLIVRQLQAGEPVWFGSDVGHSGEREMGIWSTEFADYDGTFGMDFSMTKEERLNFRESAMSHAMVITGVNLDEDGKPNRWKIENSWSDEHGKKGYYLMSAEWFREYVYQAAISRKFLSALQKKALASKPVHFCPWDPMGTLAD